jgi:hypothetical protein
VITKRLILALCAFAILIPLVGCNHRKCCTSSSSMAPPPQPCCNQPQPPAYLPGN